MTAQRPTKDFGKRRPAPLSPKEPVKRSGHVALLVMGTIAVGSTAYTLMPRSSCDPPSSEMAAPAQPNTACASRSSSGGSSGGSGGGSSRSSFYSGEPSSHSSSAASSESGSGGVTRGGFGSFAHGVGF